MVNKTALHHMGLRNSENGWVFKDEVLNKVEKADRATTTADPFRP